MDEPSLFLILKLKHNVTLLEKGCFGNTKSEEVVTLILRLMFTLYEALLRLCYINKLPCFMKNLFLNIHEEWMYRAAYS
jgi:hypothetical protein